MVSTGWIWTEAQTGNTNAAGIVLSFLPIFASESAQVELKMIKGELKHEDAWCSSLIDILSLAAVQAP